MKGLFERDKIIQSQVEEMLAACLAKYIQHPQMQVHYNLICDILFCISLNKYPQINVHYNLEVVFHL